MRKSVHDQRRQALFHANSDAAIGMCLVAHAFASGGDNTLDLHTMVISAQFKRPDQPDAHIKTGMIASFYTEDTIFLADTHLKNRSEAQAAFISPMKTALAKGVKCTNHTDFNVAPIDQMLVV